MTTLTIQLRRDTAANWTSVNPVLHTGELGVETNTSMSKLGDGSTAWNSLGYWAVTNSHLPYLDAKLLGAKFDGTTDDSSALTSALAAGTVLQLPPGTSAIASPVRLNASSVRIQGAGMYATTLKASSSNLAPGLIASGQSVWETNVEISDLTLDGNGLAGAAIHAYGYALGHLTVRRCIRRNCYDCSRGKCTT